MVIYYYIFLMMIYGESILEQTLVVKNNLELGGRIPLIGNSIITQSELLNHLVFLITT